MWRICQNAHLQTVLAKSRHRQFAAELNRLQKTKVTWPPAAPPCAHQHIKRKSLSERLSERRLRTPALYKLLHSELDTSGHHQTSENFTSCVSATSVNDPELRQSCDQNCNEEELASMCLQPGVLKRRDFNSPLILDTSTYAGSVRDALMPSINRDSNSSYRSCVGESRQQTANQSRSACSCEDLKYISRNTRKLTSAGPPRSIVSRLRDLLMDRPTDNDSSNGNRNPKKQRDGKTTHRNPLMQHKEVQCKPQSDVFYDCEEPPASVRDSCFTFAESIRNKLMSSNQQSIESAPSAAMKNQRVRFGLDHTTSAFNRNEPNICLFSEHDFRPTQLPPKAACNYMDYKTKKGIPHINPFSFNQPLMSIPAVQNTFDNSGADCLTKRRPQKVLSETSLCHSTELFDAVRKNSQEQWRQHYQTPTEKMQAAYRQLQGWQKYQGFATSPSISSQFSPSKERKLDRIIQYATQMQEKNNLRNQKRYLAMNFDRKDPQCQDSQKHRPNGEPVESEPSLCTKSVLTEQRASTLQKTKRLISKKLGWEQPKPKAKVKKEKFDKRTKKQLDEELSKTFEELWNNYQAKQQQSRQLERIQYNTVFSPKPCPETEEVVYIAPTNSSEDTLNTKCTVLKQTISSAQIEPFYVVQQIDNIITQCQELKAKYAATVNRKRLREQPKYCPKNITKNANAEKIEEENTTQKSPENKKELRKPELLKNCQKVIKKSRHCEDATKYETKKNDLQKMCKGFLDKKLQHEKELEATKKCEEEQCKHIDELASKFKAVESTKNEIVDMCKEQQKLTNAELVKKCVEKANKRRLDELTKKCREKEELLAKRCEDERKKNLQLVAKTCKDKGAKPKQPESQGHQDQEAFDISSVYTQVEERVAQLEKDFVKSAQSRKQDAACAEKKLRQKLAENVKKGCIELEKIDAQRYNKGTQKNVCHIKKDDDPKKNVDMSKKDNGVSDEHKTTDGKNTIDKFSLAPPRKKDDGLLSTPSQNESAIISEGILSDPMKIPLSNQHLDDKFYFLNVPNRLDLQSPTPSIVRVFQSDNSEISSLKDCSQGQHDFIIKEFVENMRSHNINDSLICQWVRKFSKLPLQLRPGSKILLPLPHSKEGFFIGESETALPLEMPELNVEQGYEDDVQDE
ncbi:uncharacterized protein LOC108596224 [Drosophila busckii]|uniref:uncharacterized protein LOC108596224 n=1 Tax=Drosophila busckii TaxID=30019 RepID=UPI00083F47DB|nr:uncharacterized protein LOC108596224 [Drosophila busckii]